MASLTVQVAIALFPGLLAAWLINASRNSSLNSEKLFAFRAIYWSLVGYGFSYLIYSSFGLHFDISLSEPEVSLSTSSVDELIVATTITLLISTLSVAAQTHGWISAAFTRMKISDYTGEDDIWPTVFSRLAPSGFVQVRDYDNSLIYTGWAASYSDGPRLREIYLQDAKVYGLHSAAELYAVPGMYLSIPAECCQVEFQAEKCNE